MGLDTDGSGVIDMEEFMAWRTNNRSKAFFSRVLGIDIFKAAMTFKLLDIDGSGQLERDEFVVGCVRLKGGSKAIDSECTMREIKKLRKNVLVLQRDVGDLGKVLSHEFCL